MIKIIAAVRRKPGMTHQEYCTYVRDVHGAIARANPLTVRKYVQSHIFDGAFGAASDRRYVRTFNRDSVTELWFDDLASIGQTFSDPYTQQVVGPDGANFGDLATSVSLLTAETTIEVPSPGPGAVKVMHFLAARDGLSMDAFLQGWSAAMRDALPTVAKAVRRCVQSVPLELPPLIAAYFRSETGETYDGVTSVWFDEGDVVASFRSYQNAFEAANILNASKSFFAVAREVDIFDFAELG